jgi:hypothetical protein
MPLRDSASSDSMVRTFAIISSVRKLCYYCPSSSSADSILICFGGCKILVLKTRLFESVGLMVHG